MGEAIITRRGGAGGSNIRSAQRGKTTLDSTTLDINISPVDTNSSVIFVNFQNVTSTSVRLAVRGKIIDSTTINLSKYASTETVQVTWTVVEFNNVKSLQKGDYSLITANANVQITPVDLSKSLLVCSWQSTKISDSLYGIQTLYRFQDVSNLIFEILSKEQAKRYIHWQVIEFN